MIHACGLVEAARHIVFGAGLVPAARARARGRRADPVRLRDGGARRHARAAAGAQRGDLHACDDPRVPALAEKLGTTRSAAALELWRDRLAGAVVAIGNAPTALFRLLELLDAGAPQPAAILGIPVGFVGAAESKEALADDPRGVPFLIVRGRMGGSAMTAAAVNALARRRPDERGKADRRRRRARRSRADDAQGDARARAKPTWSRISPRPATPATRAPSRRRICAPASTELPLLYPVTTEIPKCSRRYRDAIARFLRRARPRRSPRISMPAAPSP